MHPHLHREDQGGKPHTPVPKTTSPNISKYWQKASPHQAAKSSWTHSKHATHEDSSGNPWECAAMPKPKSTNACAPRASTVPHIIAKWRRRSENIWIRSGRKLMKILEQAKKESIRFDDGVNVRDTYLFERGGARFQTSLYGIKRRKDGIQEEFHAVRSDDTQGGNCMTGRFWADARQDGWRANKSWLWTRYAPREEPELRSARSGEDDEKRGFRTHTGGRAWRWSTGRLKRATTCTIGNETDQRAASWSSGNSFAELFEIKTRTTSFFFFFFFFFSSLLQIDPTAKPSSNLIIWLSLSLPLSLSLSP